MFAELEDMPGLAAPALRWRELLREPEWQYLHPTGRLVDSLQCPFGCGCAHQVVRVSQTQCTAVCVCRESGGCTDLEFAPGDIEVLELNVSRLAREIARALECRPQFRALAVRNVWQVGSWSAQGIPVLLCIPVSIARFSVLVPELAGRLKSRFILLTPTVAPVDASVLELLADNHSAVFGLDALLRVAAGGRFEPMTPPGRVFEAFNMEPSEYDENAARGAVALLKRFEARSPMKDPQVMTVFRLYCVENLSASQIAERCRCSKTTVIERLNRIRQATGSDPIMFRRIASHLEDIEEQLSDSRARRVHRQAAVD